MDGAEIFRNAVIKMGETVLQVAEEADWPLDDIDLVIPHQANVRIIDAVRRRIKADEDKIFINIQKYGNTSAATIPIAITEALEQGRIRPGANVVFTAFGAGTTWGATAFKWGPRVEPIETIEDELPPLETTALEMIKSKQEAIHTWAE
jgi:3-oxoacyl-[acyl-carrier-protein] synthase-3